MIAHVVLFKLRPEIAPAEQHALADAFLGALRHIPSIRRAQVGPRIVLGRSYEQRMRVDYGFAAILEFDDLDGLTSYLEHPMHRELSTCFASSTDEALTYDFELAEGAAGLSTLKESLAHPGARREA